MADRPIFAIFQGGGAKGIAHVGAMKAVEENEFAFAAVAGSSAGAVVATMIAAGFRADEIFDPDVPENNILRRFGKAPIDLFGHTEWRCFKRCREGFWLLRLFDRRCWRVVWGIFRYRGYFSTDEIRDFVNLVLRRKLEELYGAYSSHGADYKIPERITFRDLDYTKFPGDVLPLKIVATNMRTGGLTIFDNTLTPDVEVADAVVASIAIPIVFKPVTMRSKTEEGPYLDGGLVSNLPIWVFSEEKLAWERDWPADPPIPIVGFSLIEKTLDEKPKSEFAAFLDFFGQVVRTALSGSQMVSEQFVEDLEMVKLETTFGMLDFDKPWSDFNDAYRAGRKDATDGLSAGIILSKPDLVQKELKTIVEDIKAKINKRRISIGQKPLLHYRGNLIQLVGRRTLRVKYAVNMEEDADDRLVLDDRSNGAAEAYRTKGLVFQDFTDPQAFEYMRKYERAMVRRTLKGAICVPIFENEGEWEKGQTEPRSLPLGVFCFDSDEDIEADYNDFAVKEFIVRRSAVLQAAIKFGVS
ncbi:patatin-like phospholipase family protein [Parvibaculum sp.]|uniref:patatin-like phospholipase family protein n=1 Tax=Parvibaculum sp. TaxID=2024848 RepID=UPI00329A496B